MYQINIIEKKEYEVPETEYTNIHKKDEKENEIWEHVKTGAMIKKVEEVVIYKQVVKEINLKAIIDAFNVMD